MESREEAKRERDQLIRTVVRLTITPQEATANSSEVSEKMQEVARLTDIIFTPDATDA
jgi:hypothetical protein